MMHRRLVQLLITLISIIALVTSSHVQSVRLTEECIKYEQGDYIIPIQNGDLSLFTGPRDYYTIAVLTSSDSRHGCDVCSDLDKIVSRVAQSWYTDYLHTNLLFFVKIDLVDAANVPIFEHLAIQTIPHIWLIPPNLNIVEGNEVNPFQILDDSHFIFKIPTASFDEQVMQFARFVSEGLQKNILIRQDSPVATFAKTFAVTLLVILIIKRKGPNGVRTIPKSKVILFILIFLLIIFICGYQFTVQSGVPFIAKGKSEEIIIISGGRHYQFGIEVVLVGLNYVALASSLLVLIYLGQYNITSESVIDNEQLKFGLILFLNVGLYVLYSSLTSIVLRKDHEYPYAFTKLF
ncbi:subunit of N oligosaccharyltransferase complex [Scheffersomyces coipomensis]|uniref:subunit of N oligosaccharyltransferase complex n=1 Tax=Scheffersomyces coipomensis TaxID=1788519 RepID=UPI00315C6BD9